MPWRYFGKVDEPRISSLLQAPNFDVIVRQLWDESRVLCSHTEWKTPGLRRARFCIQIAPALFDIFFNSESGYRGEYYQSLERGLAANRLLLDALSPRLLEWAQRNCIDQNSDFIAKSLAVNSAKVWLAEYQGSPFCHLCEAEWSAGQVVETTISNGRWELGTHVHAEWGRRAYEFTKIRAFGGYLSKAGEESDGKANRAQDIHDTGWS